MKSKLKECDALRLQVMLYVHPSLKDSINQTLASS